MHWRNYISKLNIINTSKKPKKSAGKVQSFCLSVLSLQLSEELKQRILYNKTIRIKVSLYNFTQKEFFGKQWSSYELDKNSFNNLDERIYFLTSSVDESIALVFEIVGVTVEASGKEVEKSVGWTTYSFFKSKAKVAILSSDESESVKLSLYKGSPMALIHLSDPVEKNAHIKIYDNSNITIQLCTHPDFNICEPLLPENVLLHQSERLPGLVMKSDTEDGLDPFEEPEIAKFTDYVIEGVFVNFKPSLMEFEDELTKDINAERVFRSTTPTSKNIEMVNIVERRLRVGVHNGYKYTEENDLIHLKVTDPSQRRMSYSSQYNMQNTGLSANNSVVVSLPEDQCFALIFILEYVVSESTASSTHKNNALPPNQHTYQLRWTVYLPFEGNKSNSIYQGNGVSLELFMNGGSHDAPEFRLFYKDKLIKRRSSTLSIEEEIEYEKLNVTLGVTVKVKPQLNDEDIIESKHIASERATPKETSMRTTPLTEEYRKMPKVDVKDKKNEKMKEHESQIQRLSPAPRKSKQRGSEVEVPMHQFPGYQMQPYPPMAFPYYSPPTIWPPPFVAIDRSAENVNDYRTLEPYTVKVEELDGPSARGIGGGLKPIQARGHSGLGLTRAVYSRIFSAGFPEILDENGESPFVIEPLRDDVPLNFSLEERDSRQCNEIVFQYMAFSRFSEPNKSSRHEQGKSIYFSFQFYRYPVIATERLLLDPVSDQLTEHDNSTTYILRRMDSSGSKVSAEAPGIKLTYNMDPGYMKPGDLYSFLEYLSQQTLQIDVWDGDSLMPIGTCGVSLRHLLRQGKTSVQVAYELDVINQAALEDETSNALKGRLHLRMANIGTHPTSVSHFKVTPFPKKGFLVDATEPEKFSKINGTTKRIETCPMDNGRYSLTNLPYGMTGVTVRPQRVENKSQELARLLQTTDNQPTRRSQGDITSGDKIMLGGKTSNPDFNDKMDRYETIMRQLDSGTQNMSTSNEKTILEVRRNERLDRERKLRTVEMYRTHEKEDVIKKMLSGVIQKDVSIYPKFGATELFEVKIKNYFNTDYNVQIEINQDGSYIAPVVNPNELRALKRLYSVSTASEDGLFAHDRKSDTYSIFIRSKEEVIVPFKFTSLYCQISWQSIEPRNPASTKVLNSENMRSGEIEIQINFRATGGSDPATTTTASTDSKHNTVTDKNTDKILSVVRVHAFPQPAVINQIFRFYHSEQSFLKRIIRLPPINLDVQEFGVGNLSPVVRSSDPEVLVECRQVPNGTPNDVFLKIPCGPAPQVREFMTAIYLDKFALIPIQVWAFSVHSQGRVDVVAHQGQATRIVLLLKGTGTTHRVRVFSSHPEELKVGSGQEDVFTLASSTTYELTLSFTPLRVGNRTFCVNVVDVDNSTLVRSWCVCAICREPEVSKMFEVTVPVGSATNNSVIRKKISFENPYSYLKRFYINTDRPDLLMFKDSVLKMDANQTENIGIIFYPIQQKMKHKAYVFVNDEDGKNEDTLALILNYE